MGSAWFGLFVFASTFTSTFSNSTFAESAPPPPIERDFTFDDARLHGDGSITFERPRRLYRGEFARVDMRSSVNLCGAMGFGELYGATGSRSLYGSYRAVLIDARGGVSPVDECTDIVRSIRCSAAGGPFAAPRPLLQ